MALLEGAIAEGLTARAGCAVLGLSERRWREWQVRARVGDFTRHAVPAHVRPYNAQTPQERELIRSAVAGAEWADLSCRELSVKISERHGVYVSHVSIWLFEKSLGIAGNRGKRRRMGIPRPEAPDTSFLAGPNQLWAWDITKLRTGVPHRFWFLYAVLDQWSRKVVGWRLSEREMSSEAQGAWDQALLAEGRTEGAMPVSLSDRGGPMRSKSTATFFMDLGVGRLFSRPRRPNDNAYVESLFSTVKTAPAYPGVFATMAEAVAYFTAFFRWYNEEHLHTRIGMVTPSQKHSGEAVRILAERDVIKQQTMARRRAMNTHMGVPNKELEAAVS
jgi:putative transposase